SGIPADILIGISRSSQASLIIQRRLDREFLSRLEFIRPLGAYLDQLAAELMTDDRRMLCHVIRHALVVCPLHGCLIGRHTDTVRYYLCQDFIILGFRKLKLLQPQILFAVKSQCLCFHTLSPLHDIYDRLLSVSFSSSGAEPVASLAALLNPFPAQPVSRPQPPDDGTGGLKAEGKSYSGGKNSRPLRKFPSCRSSGTASAVSQAVLLYCGPACR